MRDLYEPRLVLGIVIPSIARVPQPEMEAMRPAGVINQIARVHVPAMALRGDDDHQQLMQRMRAGTLEAVDSVMSCGPDRLILCTSGDTVRGGPQAAAAFQAEIEKRAGVPVTMPGFALDAALKAALGREAAGAAIGLLTPYQPAGDADSVAFFEALGYRVAAIEGLAIDNPAAFAEVPPERLREAAEALLGCDIDAVVQMGTNLAFAELAATLWLQHDRPVIALNTALYRQALRDSGISEPVPGFGPLMG